MELCCHPNKSGTPRKRLQHKPRSTGGTQQFAEMDGQLNSSDVLHAGPKPTGSFFKSAYHLPVIDGHECIEV